MEIHPDYKIGDIVKCYMGLNRYYTCEVLSIVPGIMSSDNKTLLRLSYTRLKRLDKDFKFSILSDCVMSIQKYREIIIDSIYEV